MLKISVITVVYNNCETIADCIKSVLSQDYKNIEYIIVDGNSNDGTCEIIEQYRENISIYISEKDSGIYDAMNKGILRASGDYIAFLNADDFYIGNEVLSKMSSLISTNRTDAGFADLVFVEHENLDKVVRYYKSGPWIPQMLRFGMMPAHPTCLIKKECFDQYGLFDLSYKIAADYELITRYFFKNKISYAYLPSPIIKMRMGGVSTSGVRSSIILNTEIVRACRVNGMRTFAFFLFFKIPFKLLEKFIYPLLLKSRSIV